MIRLFSILRYKAVIRKQQAIINKHQATIAHMAMLVKDASEAKDRWMGLHKKGTEGYTDKWDTDKLKNQIKELSDANKKLLAANEDLKSENSELKGRIDTLDRVNREMDIRLKTKLCRVVAKT